MQQNTMPGITGCGEDYKDWCGLLGEIWDGLARCAAIFAGQGVEYDGSSWG